MVARIVADRHRAARHAPRLRAQRWRECPRPPTGPRILSVRPSLKCAGAPHPRQGGGPLRARQRARDGAAPWLPVRYSVPSAMRSCRTTTHRQRPCQTVPPAAEMRPLAPPHPSPAAATGRQLHRRPQAAPPRPPSPPDRPRQAPPVSSARRRHPRSSISSRPRPAPQPSPPAEERRHPR